MCTSGRCRSEKSELPGYIRYSCHRRGLLKGLLRICLEATTEESPCLQFQKKKKCVVAVHSGDISVLTLSSGDVGVAICASCRGRKIDRGYCRVTSNDIVLNFLRQEGNCTKPSKQECKLRETQLNISLRLKMKPHIQITKIDRIASWSQAGSTKSLSCGDSPFKSRLVRELVPISRAESQIKWL